MRTRLLDIFAYFFSRFVEHASNRTRGAMLGIILGDYVARYSADAAATLCVQAIREGLNEADALRYARAERN